MSVKLGIIKLLATALVPLWCSGIIESSGSQNVSANNDLNSSIGHVTVYNSSVYESDGIINVKQQIIVAPESQEVSESNEEQKDATNPINVLDTFSDKMEAVSVETNASNKDEYYTAKVNSTQLVKHSVDATTSSTLHNHTVFNSNQNTEDFSHLKPYSEDTEEATFENIPNAVLHTEIELSTVGDEQQADSYDILTSTTSHSVNGKEMATSTTQPLEITAKTRVNQTNETTTHGHPRLPHGESYDHHPVHHKSNTALRGHHPIPFRHHLQLVPMEDEPFGAVILKDERYVVSVMIPIGVGIIGAAIIIATLYTLRYIARKNAREINFPDLEHARPHSSCISSISSERTDRVVLLGGDDDDDF